MAINSFDTYIAESVGVNAAVLYQNIYFWCEKNKANNKNIYENKVYTYNSNKAFSEQFSYMSAKQIRTALEKLESEGLIETGNFNKSAYDRTKWYTCNILNSQIHLTKKANGNDQKGEPIPDSKPDSKPEETNDRSNDQSDVVEKAFEWFWSTSWKPVKKSIGKVDTSPKTFNFEKRWKPLFNRKYFMFNTPEKFKAEVNAMAAFCKEAHNADRGRFENMQLARFLSEKQWRDS